MTTRNRNTTVGFLISATSFAAKGRMIMNKKTIIGAAFLLAGIMAFPADAALVVHFDASDASSIRNAGGGQASNGENVTSWQDQTAGNHDASPAFGAPTLNTTGGPRGQAVLDFDGSTNLVSDGGTQAGTVSIVHRWDMTGGTQYLLDFRNGIGASWMYNTGIRSIGPNWDYYVNDSPDKGPEGGNVEVGQMQNNTWQITTFVGISDGSDVMKIMSRFTGEDPGVGAIAEIQIHDNVLSDGDRLALVDSLNSKWFGDVIPEPSTIVLAALGMLGLLGWGRRNRRRAA